MGKTRCHPHTHTECPKLHWLSFHARIFHSFEAMRKPRVRKRSAGYSPLVATVCAIAAGCSSVVSEWSLRLRVIDLLPEHISVLTEHLCVALPPSISRQNVWCCWPFDTRLQALHLSTLEKPDYSRRCWEAGSVVLLSQDRMVKNNRLLDMNIFRAIAGPSTAP